MFRPVVGKYQKVSGTPKDLRHHFKEKKANKTCKYIKLFLYIYEIHRLLRSIDPQPRKEKKFFAPSYRLFSDRPYIKLIFLNSNTCHTWLIGYYSYFNLNVTTDTINTHLFRITFQESGKPIQNSFSNILMYVITFLSSYVKQESHTE